jgi:hypothetical protein
LAIADLEACRGADVRVAAQSVEPVRRERMRRASEGETSSFRDPSRDGVPPL